MKKKIIVTGGCGYIGSHTVISLLEDGYEVVVFDDFSNSDVKTLDRIKQITGKTVQYEMVDLKDTQKTNKAFNRHGDAIAIIHFAAYKAVGESQKKPLSYYRNNLFGLINIVQNQLENGIENLIFSSSATVYGEPDTLPISEGNEVKRPFSVYGNTKKIAEEILQDTARANPKFSGISLRYFNPIGAHGSGLIGELPSGTPNNLMPFITQTAIGLRPELKVFGNDYETKDGTPIRDYVHVMDLGEAHVKALNYIQSSSKKTNWEAFNLGTGNGYSVLEIINTFEALTKNKLNYRVVERREGDVPELYASFQLAEQTFGWRPKRGLDEMILSSWEWERNFRKQQANMLN
ncbi:UDP-glucose 4-epimerase GalE [Maribacter cobaltidurans]|uniref:UDP-glucose 4-epimerase n=1 Tax=Maribacter cobaltidurans TaxID=1178778 RepID=A0A223V3K0_9FLAO|nr:UDP-glucose 4-epimerase GalE [Maribacter cobaltidurans]ASV29700.1 UDP-glucose 4-epimerase GalE [Maribacter cobaltidurans]GGD66630.1 UDP-glucose 4-epimerase [Maribacter cobaltidurans]